MMNFLRARAEQARARKLAQGEQDALLLERRQRIHEAARVLKELVHDPRYAVYANLLTETRRSLDAEREGLMRGTGEDWVQQALLLTGRIMQLDYILSTPENFLALADEGEPPNGDGRERFPAISAARSTAREPVGTAA